MTKFQIITIALFIIFIIAGVIGFATYKGNSSASTSLPAVTIWGTFPATVFRDYVSNINNLSATPLSVTYKQIDPTAFSDTFIAALARGTGPDAILIPEDMLLPHEDKIALIPYSALPARTFLDTYIQEAQIYTNGSGIMALPFSVDPLIMYWNRDMFNAAGIATYPRYWDEFTTLNQKLTTKDANGNLRKTAIALGDFANVTNAREILASLIFQVGNPITAYDAQGIIHSTFHSSNTVSSPKSAVEFFTQFVDPTNPNYSWNRGLADSKTQFLAGNLATYFGFASELAGIRNKNPNLNFDAAPLPQVRTGGAKAVYARMYGLSIVRSTPNANGVYQVLSVLTQPTYMANLAVSMYLPSVRTDLINQGSSDPYISIFDTAVLVAKTWLDVDPIRSAQVFGTMIESITSGQATPFQAIENAALQYDAVLKQAVGQ